MAQQIAITDLDIPQLIDVRRQLEEELNHLTASFGQLNAALAKFKACEENVKDLQKSGPEREILVPLTQSLYVPGKLKKTDTVIVDVGTGYYIEKTTPEAKQYYASKITFVQSNINTLQEVIEKKRDNMRSLEGVMQMKASQGQGQGQAVGTSS